jgi:hypothetical protein
MKDKPSSVTQRQRYVDVAALLVKLKEDLPDDAARIEIDIEYDDGGRVKIEARA